MNIIGVNMNPKPVGKNPKKERREPSKGAVKGPVKGYHIKQGK